jgi:hypothetical protein
MVTAAEQDSDTGSSSDGPDRTEQRPAWAEDLKDEILTAVQGIVGPARSRERAHLTDAGQSRGARAEDQAADLDRMIADAIAVNDKAKAEEQRDKATGDRLDALEAARPETQPVERGPLHRLMRWGD